MLSVQLAQMAFKIKAKLALTEEDHVMRAVKKLYYYIQNEKNNRSYFIYKSNVVSDSCFVYFYVCISVSDVLPLETCLAFDGKPHRHFVSKPTCCNKKCGQCGGNDCGKYTDASGKNWVGIDVVVWISWKKENFVEMENQMLHTKFNSLKKRFSIIFLMQLAIFRFKHSSKQWIFTYILLLQIFMTFLWRERKFLW